MSKLHATGSFSATNAVTAQLQQDDEDTQDDTEGAYMINTVMGAECHHERAPFLLQLTLIESN